MGKYNFDQIIQRESTESIKYAGRMEVFGRSDVIPLWVADMDFAVAPAITKALSERIKHPIYGYARVPEEFFDSAIRWMERRHQWSVQREEILLSPGVVPAFYAAVKAFTEPGDAVIIQPPVYHPFFTAVTHSKRKLLLNPLKLKAHNYEIDFDHFEECAKKAKLFLFCSPHNPVGRVWTEDELKRLIVIAQKYKLIIFSDEIHADLVFSHYKHSILANLAKQYNYDRIITGISPSKTFNIPGLGLATLMIPNKELRQKYDEELNGFPIKSYNPLSLAAFMAAYNEGEEWLTELLRYLEDTKYKVEKFIEQNLSKIQVIPSQGTYLLWLDCRSMKMTDLELEKFFTHEAKIGLSPGTLFGSQGSGFMRLNFGAPQSVVLEALERIKQALYQKQ